MPAVLNHFIDEVVPSAGVGFPPVNRDMTAVNITVAIAEKRLWVVEDKGAIVGSACVRVHRYTYADAKYLSDDWVWVREGSRSYPIFRALCEAMKTAADSTGMTLQVGVLRTDDVERKRMAYEKLGFKVLGWNLTYGL